MILRAHDLNKNINAKIFLFHGVNEGQKEEVIEKKFKPVFGENVFKSVSYTHLTLPTINWV